MKKTITIEKEVFEAILRNSVKVADLEAENIQLRQFCEEFNALNVAEENTKLKNLLKEIRGKLKYINTPKNQHNIFGNVIMAKIDEALK